MANEENQINPLNIIVPARIDPTLLREQRDALTLMQVDYRHKPASFGYLEGIINMMNSMLDKLEEGNFYAPTEELPIRGLDENDAPPLDTLALKHHGLISNAESEELIHEAIQRGKDEGILRSPGTPTPEEADMLNEPSLEDLSPAIAMHDPGAKDDETKPMAALVLSGFSGALQEVIKVGTFGANKYSPNGWMHVPDARDRYQNAAMRHWLKCMDGNRFNHDDGGIRHLAQVIWNLCAVLEFELAEEQLQQAQSEFGEPG